MAESKHKSTEMEVKVDFDKWLR